MAGRYSVKGVFEVLDGLTRPVARMEGAVRSFFRATSAGAARALTGLSAVSKRTDQVIGKFADLAKPAALAAGVGLAAAATSVVTAGADFEEAITAVGAVSLMTRDEIKDLEKQALALGSSTKFTATQVAQGMELMGRAGFDNKQILASMPGLLAAAAAEGGELAETVGVVSNTLKGMGLAASDTQRVADVLTLASARTNSSITSLGESLKNAAPIARQFKIPLEEVTSAVALLQDVGIDASEAGTATATMLTLLAAPTKEASKQMAALGIKIADAHGNMLPLPKIFEQFATASKKAGGNVKAAAVFSDLLGMRGQRAGINLTNAFTSGKFAELSKELEHAAGSAEKMASLRMQNLKGDWELLTGSIDGVSQAIFALESGAMRTVVASTGRWIDANKELIVANVDGWMKRIKAAIDELLPKAELFFAGLRMGAQDVAIWFGFMYRAGKKVVSVVARLFGGNAGMQAYNLGVVLAWLTGVIVGVSAVTRIAIGIQWTYRAVLVAVRTAKLLYTAASIWSSVAVNSETTATVLNTAKLWLNRAAQLARNAVTWIAAGAQWVLTAATTAGTAALGPATAAMWSFVAPVVAAAAALASLVMLWDALNDLATQAGGWVGVWEGVKSTFTEGSFSAGMDRHMIEKGRKQQEQAKQEKDYRRIVEANKAAAVAANPLPRGSQSDVQVPWSSLPPEFATMGTGGLFGAMPSEDASKLTSALDGLGVKLDEVMGAPPAGFAAFTPAPAAPGNPSQGVQAPVEVALPNDQMSAQAAMISAAVERAIKQGMAQAEINVSLDGSTSSGPSPSGRASTSGTGIRQPRSGAM